MVREFDSAHQYLLDKVYLKQNTTILQTTDFEYSSGLEQWEDTKATVNSVNYDFEYDYQTGTRLVETLTSKRSSVTGLTTGYDRDDLFRLKESASAPSQSGSIRFDQQFNSLNRVTARFENDGTQWSYGYDDLGQLNFGKKYFNSGDAVAGQWFEYTYDDIGNLTNKKRGGDKDGAGLNSSDLTANSLNQYTSVEVPNSINIVGQAQATASVKVSKNSGTEYTAERQGTYFHYNLMLSDNSIASEMDGKEVLMELSLVNQLWAVSSRQQGFQF